MLPLSCKGGTIPRRGLAVDGASRDSLAADPALDWPSTLSPARHATLTVFRPSWAIWACLGSTAQ
jgi:hypothetical protein